MRVRSVVAPILLGLLAACSSRFVSCRLTPEQQAGDSPALAAGAGPTASARHVTIAFLGDSLTAGLGLAPEQAFPSLIEKMFAAEGYDVDVLNAGVSGDTTAGGVRRVDQLLDANARVLVVALGGNDALRGLTARQTHDNLAAIIDAALARGVTVVLAGMQAPTNLGQDYQTAFRGVYTRLSTEYKGSIDYIPFLLEGVAGHPELNQADGIHPTAQGAKMIAEMLYPPLKNIVDRLTS
jgi:acyl-CoA thioesterase-1